MALHQRDRWPCFRDLRVYKNPETALAFLQPLAHHLGDYGVGNIAEIFDGNPPFAPRGCIAQAWSVAETLRAWVEIAGGTPVTLPDLA